MPPAYQFLLQLPARHPGHRHVEQQTARLGPIRREERFGGREGLSRKTQLPQQIRQRFTHGLVVVDDRDQREHAHQEVLMSPGSKARGDLYAGLAARW